MTNDSVQTLNIEEPLVESSSSVSQLQNPFPDSSPEDIFATMHHTYAPMVIKSLPKLSKKELSRIVQAVVEIPPEKATIDRFNQAQKNVYFTLEKVLMSKYFMMYQVALDQEMKKEIDAKIQKGEIKADETI